ncbi:amidase [Pokkaliibacter sp. MBI-7]|uniref:amidase n=1 Tax=Pokkaliibacter sp. MBI-7 TaxID=3040600 RepID=UPI00244CDF4C|nr:amidase [Pokkaliibacter sp. MBI-7]MDH2436235.1 amidase [Pokkaliibacter sp. MBI-7]
MTIAAQFDDQAVYAAAGPRNWQLSSEGVLAGLRLAFKDLFHVRGYPTGAGNPDWLASHGDAEQTSWVMQRLMEAGCVAVGRTQTDEIAYSLNGINVHYGSADNPRAAGRISGGSSSGSAVAVARGEADIGLGTDTGGSIRVPSSYCGLYGLRPSHGLIENADSVPLAPLFDTVGWMARDAETLARVGEVLLPEQPLVTPESVVLLLPEGIEQDALMPALLQWLPALPEYSVVPVSQAYLSGASEAFRMLQGRAIWQTHGDWITRVQPRFADDIAGRFRWAATITDADADQARAQAIHYVQWLAELQQEGRQLVIMPTTPGAAPLRDMPAPELAQYRERLMGMTALSGLARSPQLHIPCLHNEGAPWGLSLLGARHTDRSLLALAQSLPAAQ